MVLFIVFSRELAEDSWLSKPLFLGKIEDSKNRQTLNLEKPQVHVLMLQVSTPKPTEQLLLLSKFYFQPKSPVSFTHEDLDWQL